MYGPTAPVPPSRTGPGAGVITVRVLLAVLPMLSFGVLAWCTTLRIALIRQRTLEWTLFGLQVPATIGLLAVIGELPLESAWSDAALAVLLLFGVAVMAWFLVVDIGHHSGRGPAVPAPHDWNPYAAAPFPYPSPQSHPSPRITPELDGLSDLLRKKDNPR